MAAASSSSSSMAVNKHPQRLLPFTSDDEARSLSRPKRQLFHLTLMSMISGLRHQLCGFIHIQGGSPDSDSVGKPLQEIVIDQPIMSRGGVEPSWRYFSMLKRAALQGDWEKAKDILDTIPAADENEGFSQEHYYIITFSIGGGKGTINFFQKLVNYLPDSSISETNELGSSFLHYAAVVGNKEVATLLALRMPDLIHVADCNGELPVHAAARFSHREVLEYLISATDWNKAISQFPDGVELGQLQLFYHVVDAEFFDIALELVSKYPNIAITKHGAYMTALSHVARTDMSAFNDATAGATSAFCSQWCFFKLGKHFLCDCPQINGAADKRQQALKLVRCLCELMKSLSPQELGDIYTDAILSAASLGSHEIVELILEIFPGAVSCSEPLTNRTIFHLAIENRCEQVFNLVYRMTGYKHMILGLQDIEGNNMLHLAARLAPPAKLNQVSGAALQMQRDIQWYKAVEGAVSTFCRRQLNYQGKTPAMIFTEEHGKLKNDGEKWIKGIANSCSIVAVLIITIMFAAAITVPGGNNDHTGFPIFKKDKTFIVFAVADVVSLFTSTIWLLIFLSMLTSRFSEDSFLYHHPTRLILGLGTLFFSIASMMVAYIATIFLVLGKKTAWILIPMSTFGCLSVVSFMMLQFPLLVDLIRSTYGRSIFDERKGGKPLL